MNNLMSKYAATVMKSWNGKSPWPYYYQISESGVSKEWIETLVEDVSNRWGDGEKLKVNTNLLRRSWEYGGQSLVDICHKHLKLTYRGKKTKSYEKAVDDYWESKRQGSSIAELWSFLESGTQVIESFERMLKSPQGGVVVSDEETQETVSSVLTALFIRALNAGSVNSDYFRVLWLDVEADANVNLAVREVLSNARIVAESTVLNAQVTKPATAPKAKIL